MSESDKATRNTAVPFTANPYCVNLGQPNDDDSLQIVDFFGTVYATPALRVMRMSSSNRGNMIQAYLNIFLTVATSITAKIAIGRFDTDGVTAVTPTQAEIDASHLKLTGTSSAISSSGGSLIIDGLNLLKQIPTKSDPNFNVDGFVLIVQFSRDLTTNDRLQRFEVACSMQIGLL